MPNDKKKAIQDLKKIRDTGKFNMFMDINKVLNYANKNNMFNLITYVGNERGKYLELLEEDWSNI